MRNAILLFAAFLAPFAAGCNRGGFPVLPREAQVKMYDEYILHKPAPPKIGSAHLIGGVELIKQMQDISPLATALTTVGLKTGGRGVAQNAALLGDAMFAFASDYAGVAPSLEQMKQLRDLQTATTREYWETQGDLLMGTVLTRTRGERDAMAIAATLDGTKYVQVALHKIARLHGRTPTLDDGEKLPFEKYKEYLDKDIPALLEIKRGKIYRIGIGYVDSGYAQYLIVANLFDVPFERKLVTPNYQTSAEAAQRMPPQDVLATVDYETSDQKPLGDGIEIEPFASDRYAHTYFIYEWRVSPEGLAREVGKILKCQPKIKIQDWLLSKE
jgi:hypothetical protein